MEAATPLIESTRPSALFARPTPCAHCGLPVPVARIDLDAGRQFCCDGCCQVYAILQGSGLQQYYQYRGQDDAAPSPATPSRRRFDDFDAASFHERYCHTLSSGLERVELFLEGVHCSACVWLVERVNRVAPGVVAAELDLSRSVATVVWDPKVTALSAVARALDSLGYTPHATRATQLEAERRQGDRALLLRLGVAGAAAGNVMLMAFALYGGLFSGMSHEYQSLFRWLSFAIATPSVFYSGGVFLRGGWAALRTRALHMDLPVSIGILTGYAGGAWNTLRGTGEVYFDSLCTLIFLLLVGRFLQRKHHRAASNASELLSALAPTTARVLVAAEAREVPTEDLRSGQTIVVAPGERIAADGVINSGSSAVDVSLLTGESLPEEVAAGDKVYAGTVNQSAELHILVESAGKESRLGRLLESVTAAQRERAPIVRLADRVAGYFVFVVLGVAALTLAIWLQLDPSRAIDHTVALLVVTCPCALGMATPLAVSAALRQAAQVGILFKGGEFIEALARPGLIVFDKTGTLTEGRLELVAFHGDKSVIPWLRAVEARSTHPIARAFLRAFPGDVEPVALFDETPGGGVDARIAEHTLLVGSCSWLRLRLTRLPEWAEAQISTHSARGETPVLVALDGALVAVAAFADRVRADGGRELERLRRLGFECAVLSGDQQVIVDRVAAELGGGFMTALGNQSPEQKLAFVKAARGGRRNVIMVGDGVNDAAALAAASIGIAVHGGAEASLEAADAFTTQAGLRKIADAADGARRTLAVIRHGIAFSLLYNALGVALALSGALSPLVAAVLMPLSSITVVSVALRARTFRAKGTP
ncbi:MAG TPA: heavy metal translocating P-type ATPase [Polyangiaceae bacterium]|jgi:Cu2+-exporting ATPase